MEIPITNLRGVKAKDGNVYLICSDSQLINGDICVSVIKGVSTVKYTPEGSDIVKKAWI